MSPHSRWLVIERACALLLLVMLSPLLLVAAVAVLREDGRPIVFRQSRAGLHGKPFVVYKLRTLHSDAPPPEQVGQVAGAHALVTRTGLVLRRSKLDEVPQLLNVVRGDMRFVGPRPALVSDLDRYGDFEQRRFTVLPGITGWAQVHGNTALSWPDRIALDVWYIDHWSPRLDAAVIAKTIMTILKGERPAAQQLSTAREHAERSRRSS